MNHNNESMGARRLQSVVEKILEEISYNAPDYSGETIHISAEFVRERLKGWDDKVALGKYLI